MRSTASGESTRAEPTAPPSSSMRQKIARSAGRAEEARVPGDASHAARRGVVHDTAERGRLRRGDAAVERSRRVEHRVAHAERLEDPLPHEHVELHLRDALDDFARA